MEKVESFIVDIGGRKSVVDETGLTKARISQWVVDDEIPRSWLRYFELKYPEQCKKHGIGKFSHNRRRSDQPKEGRA